ncbi:hypothetical protein TSUD_42080 [Trifolium subterraneum]|uniref:Uncharacterized protein n=1 Tax=Trifolium subterraneum TaxID=3900 RepID=A0A2Z6LVZ1_TRISU|nr:hypothetical protein TSUD_42080 [Trifolium subterraneum]
MTNLCAGGKIVASESTADMQWSLMNMGNFLRVEKLSLLASESTAGMRLSLMNWKKDFHKVFSFNCAHLEARFKKDTSTLAL